ncbi:hypothetical protein KCU93_g355, partial [Aureobasidium melanogenum]
MIVLLSKTLMQYTQLCPIQLRFSRGILLLDDLVHSSYPLFIFVHGNAVRLELWAVETQLGLEAGVEGIWDDVFGKKEELGVTRRILWIGLIG